MKRHSTIRLLGEVKLKGGRSCMKLKFCPKCLSKNVEWKDSRMGAAEGNWICNKCGFYNILFPEAKNESELKRLKKQK